jgi:hypothetical protein
MYTGRYPNGLCWRHDGAVAARLRVSRPTVTKWRARFLARRLDGLADEPRPGVPRAITDARVEEVVTRTLEETPEGATHWSKRELAKQVGMVPGGDHRPAGLAKEFLEYLRVQQVSPDTVKSYARAWRCGGSTWRYSGWPGTR